MSIRSAAVCVVAVLLSANLQALAAGPAEVPPKLSVEEVKQFMRDLADYAEKHHFRLDANIPMAGRPYEFVKTPMIGQYGQWIEPDVRDSMHDGAWYGWGLVQAYVATGEDRYKSFLDQWLLPFYVNTLNNSDTLFADGLKTEMRAKKTSNRFGTSHMYRGEKGFMPYWWDNGEGSKNIALERQGFHENTCVDVYEAAGQPNPEFRTNGYSLGCSNHMAQDLAVLLGRSWLLTRDAKVAEAAQNLHESRQKHSQRNVAIVLAVAGMANNDPAIMARVRGQAGNLPTGGAAFLGLRNGFKPPAHKPKKGVFVAPKIYDPKAFTYLGSMIRSGGELTPAIASHTVYDVATHMMMTDLWYDETGPVPGMWHMENGATPMTGLKYVSYQSDKIFRGQSWPDGSRGGIQFTVHAAIGLQMLKAMPGCWERIAEQKTPDSLRVYFVDEPIILDGGADGAYGEAVDLDGTRFQFASDALNLYVAGRCQGDSVRFAVLGDKTDDAAVVNVEIWRDGSVTAAMADGKAVQCEVRTGTGQDMWTFELKLPYAVNKTQADWANAVETAYLAVKAGDAKKDLFFLSSEERIEAYLLNKVEGCLAVWNRVFREVGYVPMALYYHPQPKAVTGDWFGEVSDLGGYAHLLTVAAEYLLYKSDRTDWQEAKFPKIEVPAVAKAPKAAKAAPAGQAGASGD